MTETLLPAQEFFKRATERPDSDPDGKIADFTEAIRLKPDYARAYYYRGLVLSDIDDYDGAIRDYTEAIRLDPNHARVFLHRGNARKSQGDLDGAIRDYTE